MSASVSLQTGAGSAPTRRLVALSVALWAVGLLALRWLSLSGLLSGRLSWLMLPRTLPLVWATLHLVRRVAGAQVAVMQAAGLASAPALLLDGVVVSWMPWLYTPHQDGQRAAAGLLLWFVGATLALASWQAARQARHL